MRRTIPLLRLDFVQYMRQTTPLLRLDFEKYTRNIWKTFNLYTRNTPGYRKDAKPSICIMVWTFKYYHPFYAWNRSISFDLLLKIKLRLYFKILNLQLEYTIAVCVISTRIPSGYFPRGVYKKKCCNLHNAFMVRRFSLGENNHLTY